MAELRGEMKSMSFEVDGVQRDSSHLHQDLIVGDAWDGDILDLGARSKRTTESETQHSLWQGSMCDDSFHLVGRTAVLQDWLRCSRWEEEDKQVLNRRSYAMRVKTVAKK